MESLKIVRSTFYKLTVSHKPKQTTKFANSLSVFIRAVQKRPRSTEKADLQGTHRGIQQHQAYL